MSEDLKQMLARIEERLNGHVERYDRDHQETRERYLKENEERNEWRKSIESTVGDLKNQISPVVRDHQMIVNGGKWIAGGAAGLFGMIKGWVFIREHLK